MYRSDYEDKDSGNDNGYDDTKLQHVDRRAAGCGSLDVERAATLVGSHGLAEQLPGGQNTFVAGFAAKREERMRSATRERR